MAVLLKLTSSILNVIYLAGPFNTRDALIHFVNINLLIFTMASLVTCLRIGRVTGRMGGRVGSTSTTSNSIRIRCERISS